MIKKNLLIPISICLTLLSSQYAFAEKSTISEEFTLPQMNITALGYKSANLETPSDVTVYTGDELKQTGARNVANALKYKPGIYFSQMGPHDQSFITGNSTISLRGIKGGTLVLINGVPAGFNNVSHLDMINLETVEKVEIIKGGGAVLYGSEAYGGVINVITKDSYQNNLHIATGNKGQHDYAATIGAGKLGISLGRNESGETGILSEVQGTKTINGEKFPIIQDLAIAKKIISE